MKTAMLVLVFTGVALAALPSEVVSVTNNLSNSDISLRTGKRIIPLSGVSPNVFDSQAFSPGSSDILGSYYTQSMIDFLSSDSSAGNPNIIKKGAMIGLLWKNMNWSLNLSY